MTLVASTQLFWVVSRGAGIAALALATMSVAVGASMHMFRARRADMRVVHEALALATLACLALHGGALLFDGWLRPGLTGITVPFTASYRPAWTGIGIIAGYGMAVLALSYYARRWIGPARWRAAHGFIICFWALGAVHAVGAGTDTSRRWFLILMAVPLVPALAAVATGLTGHRSRAVKRGPPRQSGDPLNRAV